jgi:hypothetical protein
MIETNSMESVPWAAIGPIAALALAFAIYCLFDLARSDVRYLPKWAWAVLCVVSIPVGGIVYLLVGKAHR